MLSNEDCLVSIDFKINTNSSYVYPESVIRIWITTLTTNIIITPPTIYINMLVIWTVLENKILRSSSYNLLLAILSLTDFLVGIVAQPILTTANMCLLLRSCGGACELVLAYTLSLFLCVAWSVSTLAVVSIERYLAVEHPIYYRSNVTTKKLFAVTAIIWMLLPLLLIGRLQTDGSYKARQVPLALVFGLSVVIIFYCMGKVSLTARRQRKAINCQQTAVQGTETVENKIRDYKRTFTLGILVLASVLFYLPSVIIKIIGLVKGLEWSAEFKYTSQLIWVTALHIQSLVNPLIMSLRLAHIRAGVYKKLFCRWKNHGR